MEADNRLRPAINSGTSPVLFSNVASGVRSSDTGIEPFEAAKFDASVTVMGVPKVNGTVVAPDPLPSVSSAEDWPGVVRSEALRLNAWLMSRPAPRLPDRRVTWTPSNLKLNGSGRPRAANANAIGSAVKLNIGLLVPLDEIVCGPLTGAPVPFVDTLGHCSAAVMDSSSPIGICIVKATGTPLTVFFALLKLMIGIDVLNGPIVTFPVPPIPRTCAPIVAFAKASKMKSRAKEPFGLVVESVPPGF